jgi:hypothetical protein
MCREQPEEAAMTRRDAHLDAMLRHLGAAYYESQHGRASSADVTRALGAVEEHNGDQPVTAGAAQPTSWAGRGHGTDRDPLARQVRWRQRVRDVMTTKAITVDRITVTGRAGKKVTRLLRSHGFDVAVKPESFLVTTQNMLDPEETTRARDWAAKLAASIAPG